MTTPQALIVDDEPDILELLRITLTRMRIDTHAAATLAEARRLLDTQPCDFCLTDMRLPDGSGIELIRHIAATRPDLPVAMITAHGNLESAVEAMKAGAFDFVAKPLDLRQLRQLVTVALQLAHDQGNQNAARSTPRPDTRPDPASNLASAQDVLLLGDSPAMAAIRALIPRLARSQAPVCISGESGTGKELAARLIHALGPRQAGPFVPVNCGAIPPDLIESELFGHCKGSFTGATSDREGLFQAASGGTLFLDEIADLPLLAQVKLLRAIQERQVRPVGARHEIPVDARILSASHRDLAREVEQGRFRQDLYYRINVIELRMPALRERPDDIPLLAVHLLASSARRQGREPPVLTPEALEALTRRAFPGNVRELENLLERALALCDDDAPIGVDDLGPPRALMPAPPADPAPAGAPDVTDLQRLLALRARLGEDRDAWSRAAARLGISPRSLRHRLERGLGRSR